MSEKVRLSRIALDYGIPPHLTRYDGLANDKREPNVGLDLCYLHYMVTEKSEGNWPPDVPVHIYEMLDFRCNAAVNFNDGELEMAMFAGLRDVLFTYAKLVQNETRLFEDIGSVIDGVSVDYAKFPEPVGFQNIARLHNGAMEYYPNSNYNDYWVQFINTKNKERFALGEVIRISSELFIWFHELSHFWRKHILLIDEMTGRKKMTLSEMESPQADKTLNMILRFLEHDADRMAVINLVENIRQERGMFNHLAKFAGIEHAYRLIFFSVFCTMDVLMIGQLIERRGFIGEEEDETHPYIVNRVIYIADTIERIYGNHEPIITSLYKATEDWKTATNLFGWKQFINSKITFAIEKQEDLKSYCDQVNEFLTNIDNAMK